MEHVLRNARGCGKQVILELESPLGGAKVQVRQTLFCQKAQGQMGHILQQRRVPEAVDLLEEEASLVFSVPLNHVFEVQEEVRHGRALLKEVAVVGILRPITQGFHELRDLDVCRAGEGRNAVVAVEGAVVQGLGMGGLRPEEGGILFPLFHVANDRGSLFLTLGVVRDVGACKVDAKAHQGADELHPHDGEKQAPGEAPLASPVQTTKGLFLLVPILGHLRKDGTIQGRKQIENQENAVVNDIEGNLQGALPQLQGHGGSHVLAAGQNRGPQGRSCQNMPGLEGPPQEPGPVGHVQHHKAVQEAEAVGNHIGEVEAVPDVVQLPDDKAHVKEEEQSHGAELVPELYLLRQKEQHHENDAENTAVDVGQALFEIGLDGAAHVPRHLNHGAEKAHKRILLGDVQPEACGEFIDARLGGLERCQGRKLQDRRHADGNGREQGNSPQVQEELFPAAKAAEFITEEQQEYKNTGKKPDIVVGKNGLEQRQGVEQEFSVPQKRHGAQGHQREQCEGIQPHDVPLKAQGPGAQAVEPAEDGNGQIVLSKELFQENGEEQPCKAQFHGHQQGKIAQKPAFRHQDADQVQRRGQIVGDQPQIVHAQAHAPGVEKPLPFPQCPPKLHEEGVVLVVHIGIEHGIVSKGTVGANQHDKQHSHAGNQKGQSQGIYVKSPFCKIHRDLSRKVD